MHSALLEFRLMVYWRLSLYFFIEIPRNLYKFFEDDYIKVQMLHGIHDFRSNSGDERADGHDYFSRCLHGRGDISRIKY